MHSTQAGQPFAAHWLLGCEQRSLPYQVGCMHLPNCSFRNYRSPSRHWRLTFRVGDHQLATWSPKKKKKEKEKEKNRAVANLSQRRRADRERAFFLPFFRFRGFGLIKNETRTAKVPLVTRRPTRGAAEQYSAEPAQHVLSTRAVARPTTKRQHYTMSQ